MAFFLLSFYIYMFSSKWAVYAIESFGKKGIFFMSVSDLIVVNFLKADSEKEVDRILLHTKHKIYPKFIALCSVFVFLILFIPSHVSAFAETAEYCKKCHVMESEYEAWIHSGAHRRQQCVECHLPYENKALHYLWKSIDGLKDIIIFHSGRVPELIRLSSHGEKTVQANCIRCHETAVSMIDKERKCWQCHRRSTHRLTGSIETF